MYYTVPFVQFRLWELKVLKGCRVGGSRSKARFQWQRPEQSLWSSGRSQKHQTCTYFLVLSSFHVSNSLTFKLFFLTSFHCVLIQLSLNILSLQIVENLLLMKRFSVTIAFSHFPQTSVMFLGWKKAQCRRNIK